MRPSCSIRDRETAHLARATQGHSYLPERGPLQLAAAGMYLQVDEVVGQSAYGYAGSNPLVYVDPLGLAYSSAKCRKLRQYTDDFAGGLSRRISQYDPLTDLGGKQIGPKKGGGITGPGGHYTKLRGQQQELQNLINEFDTNCGPDDDGEGPDCPELDTKSREVVTRFVPAPPGHPDHMRQMMDSIVPPGTIYFLPLPMNPGGLLRFLFLGRLPARVLGRVPVPVPGPAPAPGYSPYLTGPSPVLGP